MADTFVKIATVNLSGGSQATISFTSIPQTYTDLCLKWSLRDTFAAVSTNTFVSFNSVASGYSIKRLRGDGATADSYSETAQASLNFYNSKNGSSSTASTFSNGELYIPNYAGAAYKSCSLDAVLENNATTAYIVLYAGLWSNTAAITSITLAADTAMAQYSTATLYGIKNS